jgi:hypothetical protein
MLFGRFYLFVVFSFHFHCDGRKCEGIVRNVDIARTLEDWPTAAFIHKNSITCHDWCVKFFVERKKNKVRRSARWKTLVRFHPPYGRSTHERDTFFCPAGVHVIIFLEFFFLNNEKRVAASFFSFVCIINFIASYPYVVYVRVATHFEKCFQVTDDCCCCCCGEFLRVFDLSLATACCRADSRANGTKPLCHNPAERE